MATLDFASPIFTPSGGKCRPRASSPALGSPADADRDTSSSNCVVLRAAGVSSKRLSQRLIGSQPPVDEAHVARTAYQYTGAIAGARDNVGTVLRNPFPGEPADPVAAVLERGRVDDYAGMRSDGINELKAPSHGRGEGRGRRHAAYRRNESIFVADALGHQGQTIGAAAEFQDPRVAAQLQEQYKPRTRNLKPYYGPEELNKAFCTKFQVVDKASGRTDIMTARRPGSANAVVNLSAFDAYSMRTPKLSSALKQISSIENSPLGLMPRPGAESSEKTARPSAGACMNRSQLHCKDSWLAPDENASTRRHLGESKRHVALFWAQRPTGTILQHVSSPKRPLPSRYTVARQLHSVASDLRPDHPPVHEAHRKREHVSMDSTQLEEDQNHRLPPPCVDFENPSDFHQRQRETKIHEYSQQLKSYDNARRAAIEVERQQLADEERYYQAQLQHYERERQRQEAQDKAMERLQQEYYKGPFEKKSVPEYPFKRDPQH